MRPVRDLKRNLTVVYFNTFTVDDEYFRCNRKNLPQLFRMQLSKTQRYFSAFFVIYIKLCAFSKKEPHSLSIFKIIGSKRRSYLNE